MHFFITGFMGSGKSYWTQRMAELCSLPCVDLDAIIEAQEGKSIHEIFAQSGEAYFREREANALRMVSELSTPHLIACGGGTSCSPENRQVMKEHGYVILIQEPLDTLVQRLIKEKKRRPLLANIPDHDFKNRLAELITQRQPCYEQYDFLFVSGSTEPATFAQFILDHA